jgi:hypothetical protein
VTDPADATPNIPRRHLAHLEYLFQGATQFVTPDHVRQLRSDGQVAAIADAWSAWLVRAMGWADCYGLAEGIDTLRGNAAAWRGDAAELLALALRAARCQAALAVFPLGAVIPAENLELHRSRGRELAEARRLLARELRTCLRMPEQDFAALREAIGWAARVLTGGRPQQSVAAQPAAVLSTAPLPASALAAIVGADAKLVAKFLERYRKKHFDCFTQCENRKPTDPRYLYHPAAVLPALQERFGKGAESSNG